MDNDSMSVIDVSRAFLQAVMADQELVEKIERNISEPDREKMAGILQDIQSTVGRAIDDDGRARLSEKIMTAAELVADFSCRTILATDVAKGYLPKAANRQSVTYEYTQRGCSKMALLTTLYSLEK